ncbi:DUF397 domain-containing protein [Amycolatopsis sp. YIM 10]|uniref:DUF397 domain-containing protein n=1 Tax=Amycolatopsis sp. YIM 10 TaxID=2653857 RepID=UPI0012901A3B|nr:DUF397 domain-containing protein [Amycolatopsis sp. YIM 10]QFU86697.1 hypothetical protein YIM_07430 [Amycolatopsis sp. YIM 10]
MHVQNSHKPHLNCDFTNWAKSPISHPNGQECVEIAVTDNAIGIRDSRKPDGAVLVFDHAEWNAFVAAVESGFFRRQ